MDCTDVWTYNLEIKNQEITSQPRAEEAKKCRQALARFNDHYQWMKSLSPNNPKLDMEAANIRTQVILMISRDAPAAVIDLYLDRSLPKLAACIENYNAKNYEFKQFQDVHNQKITETKQKISNAVIDSTPFVSPKSNQGSTQDRLDQTPSFAGKEILDFVKVGIDGIVKEKQHQNEAVKVMGQAILEGGKEGFGKLYEERREYVEKMKKEIFNPHNPSSLFYLRPVPEAGSNKKMCAEQITQVVKEIQQCPRSKQLWEEVSKAGKFSMKTVPAHEAPTGAQVNIYNRVIEISERENDINRIREHLVLELNNLKRADAFKIIHCNACTYPSEVDYARAIEKVEYSSRQETNEVVNDCKVYGLWPDITPPNTSSSFEEHFTGAILSGHSEYYGSDYVEHCKKTNQG